MRYQGLGTEKLHAEIEEKFPGHVCQRMDSDTMTKPGSHQRVLDAFRDGLVHILVGTQMIAKGHDFPRVTLVGVVSADVGLGLADFRAAERSFQLLTQVAGRAGRGIRQAPAGLARGARGDGTVRRASFRLSLALCCRHRGSREESVLIFDRIDRNVCTCRSRDRGRIQARRLR